MPFFKDKRKFLSRNKQLTELSNINGLRHSLYSACNDRYIGEWKDNAKEGKGTYLSRTSKLYDGDWKSNYRHGFGVLCWRNENKTFILEYRGDWKKGLECGFGARHYVDGGYYLGYFKNGKRHGYGQMWYSDGSFYDGDWVKDLKHGLGMLVRSDGNRYEGAWSLDLKHGRGRFFHLDSGQMQEGIWRNDLCVYSFVIDIPFRQTSARPTSFPIQDIQLANREEITDDIEHKAILGQIFSCLSLSKASLNSKPETF